MIAEYIELSHIKPSGDWDELYFRDYLRQYPDVAFQYGILKQNLNAQFKHNRDAYTKGKTDFIRLATKRAREEFAKRNLTSKT